MRRLFNISRPCYNKFHRCPGSAGGGIHDPRAEQCDGGYLGAHYAVPHWKWRPARCPQCGVLVLPYMTRWLDPGFLIRWKLAKIPGKLRDWRDDRARREI